jgi:hypothetical protein
MTEWTLESISEAVGFDLTAPDRQGPGRDPTLLEVRPHFAKGAEVWTFAYRKRELVLARCGRLALKTWVDGVFSTLLDGLDGREVQIRDVVWLGRADTPEKLVERWIWLMDGGPSPVRTLTARKRRNVRRRMNLAIKQARQRQGCLTMSPHQTRRLLWLRELTGLGALRTASEVLS